MATLYAFFLILRIFADVFFFLLLVFVISAVNIVFNMNVSSFPNATKGMNVVFFPHDRTKSFNMRFVSFSISEKVANHGNHPRISIYQFRTIQIFS